MSAHRYAVDRSSVVRARKSGAALTGRRSRSIAAPAPLASDRWLDRLSDTFDDLLRSGLIASEPDVPADGRARLIAGTQVEPRQVAALARAGDTLGSIAERHGLTLDQVILSLVVDILDRDNDTERPTRWHMRRIGYADLTEAQRRIVDSARSPIRTLVPERETPEELLHRLLSSEPQGTMG